MRGEVDWYEYEEEGGEGEGKGGRGGGEVGKVKIEKKDGEKEVVVEGGEYCGLDEEGRYECRKRWKKEKGYSVISLKN